MSGLQGQKPFLPGEAWAEPPKPPSGHHPVAGNKDGEGVVGQGLPHGPRGLRPSQLRGKLPIGHGFPIGNAPKFLPDLAEEGRALPAHRHGKPLYPSLEVRGELGGQNPEHGAFLERPSGLLVGETQGHDGPALLPSIKNTPDRWDLSPGHR